MVDKYTFRREYTDHYGQTKIVEHTLDAETLDEIVEGFLYFLNGCSFTYVKDMIFVKDDGVEVSVMDWQVHNEDPKTADDLNQMTLNFQEIARQLY